MKNAKPGKAVKRRVENNRANGSVAVGGSAGVENDRVDSMTLLRSPFVLCLAASAALALLAGVAGVGKSAIAIDASCPGGASPDEAGTCPNAPDVDDVADPTILPTEELSITITNKSPYRVDVYYDDGDYGLFMGILDKDESTSLKSYVGHSFFVTRHGVKEGLFSDPGTDREERLTFNVGRRRDQIFLVPENSAPSTNPCQDRFSICKSQAMTGGCDRSPGWMIVHCCESCDTQLNARELLDPRKRCSKEQLKTPENVWGPGDLNKLFSGWATDEKMKKTYGLQVVSSPEPEKYGATWENAKDGSPWVVVFDNFLTDDEVRDLIRGGELEGYERSTDQGAISDLGEMEKVVSKTRTSANSWCMHKCSRLTGVQSATKKIEEITGFVSYIIFCEMLFAIRRFSHHHSLYLTAYILYSGESIPEVNYESFQLLKYEKNQFYRSHHDTSATDDTAAGHRILTFFL
jgi:hypothetical protein